MKLTKKTVILAISLLAVLCCGVFGTVAYLIDEDDVTNTFTIGQVDIIVNEVDTENGKPVDAQGNVVEKVEEAARTEEGNDYPLIPGAVYPKDPTLTIVKSSEESYYRMMVTINNIADLNAFIPGGFLPQNHVNGWVETIWPCVNIIDNGDDTYTYEFRYAGALTGSADADVALEPLFTELVVPTMFDNEDVKALEDLSINVTGHAIQKVGFDNADAAWAAFDAQVAADKAVNP